MSKKKGYDVYGFLNKISEKWKKLSKKDKEDKAKMIAGSKSVSDLSSFMDFSSSSIDFEYVMAVKEREKKEKARKKIYFKNTNQERT